MEADRANPEQTSTGSSTHPHQPNRETTPQRERRSASKNSASRREVSSMDDLPEEAPPKMPSKGNPIEVQKCGALLTPGELGKARAAIKRKPEKGKFGR